MHPNFRPAFALSVVTSALLAACGGGGGSDGPVVPASVALTGTVADGPLQGATVCYDLNDNLACDAGEPVSAATDANGKYTIDIAAADAGKHAVIAQVPATAIDKDTGAAVGTAFTLKSPATGSAGAQTVFVSALTTAVADIAKDGGKTVADATAEVRAALGLAVSPLADFTAAGGDAGAALAAKALTAVIVDTHKLAAANGVPVDQAALLVKSASTGQLGVLASALAGSTASGSAAKAAEAAAAVKAELNLSDSTVKAVAETVAKPVGASDAAGPFVTVRRFAYTDAANYSYTLITGDSSKTDASGQYTANEIRKTLSAGADLHFNRNQAYWTGSDWQVCALQWEVVGKIKPADANGQTSSTYCGASKSEGKVAVEDIAGKTLREVVTRIRAYPLTDSVGPHTDATGLPVNWGPAPSLLPADAVFPAGSKYSSRSAKGDIGGTERIELAAKSNVRWSDGRFRQAVTLEQLGGMPGNLADAAAVPSNANTVFVFDLPLPAQPDATLEAVKRYRAGFDIGALKIRFYQCDVRKSDQAALNCAAKGDGTLAIATQGDARVLKVTSGFPAEIVARLGQERFWAERTGTVFRGVRDLERTRYDQRINGAAWTALRTALAIPAHTDAVAPATAGEFFTLRNFSFTDLNNYSYRAFDGDSRVLDANGYYVANEVREAKVGGVLQPFVRNRLYWTGSEWFDCGNDGAGINLVNSKAPFDNVYCKTYRGDRAGGATLTLAGRRMSDVVNDIRAFGSKDFGDAYDDWGPNPAVHTQLANSFFPVGATMEYRGELRKATPIAVVTDIGNKVRVAPADSTVPFNTWPYAASLDEFIAKYPGDLIGTVLNGSTAFFVHGYDLPAAPSATLTTRVEIRVAFDANGSKARFYQNNRLASNNGTTNYVKLFDTTYSVETLGGVRVLKFAAMPPDFEANFNYQRMFAERLGAVWYAHKDSVPAATNWSIRMNQAAAQALGQALGVN